MLRWLLKHEGYPPGVVFAVLLHGGLILFLIGRQFQPQEMVPLERPVFITASITKENPQQQRAQQQRVQERQQQQAREQEQQRQAEAQRQRQEQERQRQAEATRQREADAQKQRDTEAEKQRQAQAQQQRQAEADKQRQAEAEKQRQAEAEAQKQRQAEAEKQRQAQAEAERQRQAEAERQRQEAERQAAAAAEADAAATNLVSQYAALIHDLVSQNWNRPPGARNGMTAVVAITMTPTGEIVVATITQSSGDTTFDRSVEQAVKGVGRIPEMQDLPNAVFERNFRSFLMTFTPEDLLR